MSRNVNQNGTIPASDGHKLLSLLHRPPAPGVTQPWLLVLMHGVGSNEDDLFGLSDFVPAPFHVVSLRAPFVLGPDSYAWFEFSVALRWLAPHRRRPGGRQPRGHRAHGAGGGHGSSTCRRSAWCSAASARAASWR
jgi:hypothetical protein